MKKIDSWNTQVSPPQSLVALLLGRELGSTTSSSHADLALILLLLALLAGGSGLLVGAIKTKPALTESRLNLSQSLHIVIDESKSLREASTKRSLHAKHHNRLGILDLKRWGGA